MKIFIAACQPMTNELIKEIETFINANSQLNVSGKIMPYEEWDEDDQTAFIDLPESENEYSIEANAFILAAHEFGDLQCFDGEPKFENGEWVNCL